MPLRGLAGSVLPYLTDTYRPADPKAFDYLAAWGNFEMALDCSFPPRTDPRNHNDWNLAQACIERVKPARTWLTHAGHHLDAWLLTESPAMPANTLMAHDGLVINIGCAE